MLPQMMPLPWVSVFLFIFMLFYSIFLYFSSFYISFFSSPKVVKTKNSLLIW